MTSRPRVAPASVGVACRLAFALALGAPAFTCVASDAAPDAGLGASRSPDAGTAGDASAGSRPDAGPGDAGSADAHAPDAGSPEPPTLPPEPPTGPELATIAVDEDGLARAIPPDFLGLSIEFDSVRPSLGVSPTNANDTFLALLGNLGRGVLRIGGNSTDYSCWNPNGAPRPKGCLYDVTPAILASIAHAASVTGWGVILGANLALDPAPRALAFARDGVAQAFSGGLLGLEIGNEPNLYEARELRPAPYSIADYEAEWAARAALYAGDAATADLPLAGPAIASGSSWEKSLDAVVKKTDPAIATTHFYALGGCGGAVRTIDELLSEATRTATYAWAATVAKAGGAPARPVRVAETNSISCSGQKGVSDTFAAALWSVDHAYTLARAGLAGANFHLWQDSSVMHGFGDYDAITAQGVKPASPGDPYTYETHARPLYYGLAFFAATRGEATIPASFADRKANLGLHAVRAMCGGAVCVRVVVINADAKASGHVAITTKATYAHGRLFRLVAASLDATGGVTIGGAAVDDVTGHLAPPTRTELSPPSGGAFVVNVPYASATIVELVGD